MWLWPSKIIPGTLPANDKRLDVAILDGEREEDGKTAGEV